MSPRARMVMAPGRVQIAHVQKVPVGTTGAVHILGAWYVKSFAGVNGKGGFQTGTYERRMNEEGAFTIAFPNASGSDGILHRDRFLITAQAYNNYRPGDEWFEIWKANDENRPTDLQYVGTPSKAVIDRDTITLTGWDALWTLKRVRDNSGSFWCHDPRTVFDHYSRAWVADISDSFDGATLDPAWTVTPSNGGTANVDGVGSLVLTTGGSPSSITVTQPISTNQDRWSVTAIVSAVSSSIAGGEQHLDLFVKDTGAGTQAQIRLAGNRRVVEASCSDISGTIADSAYSTPVTLPVELKLEGDADFVYAYANGTLAAVIPAPQNGFAPTEVGLVAGFGAGRIWKIDSVLARTCRPYLNRSGNDGDMRLPGLPPPGGLIGEYFDEHDLKVANPAFATWQLFSFNGTRTPSQRRLDPLIAFTATSVGPPAYLNAFAPVESATAGGDTASIRWVGSVFLDFSTFDYALQLANVDNIAALFIGDVRVPHLTAASGGTVTGSWMKAGSSSASAPSGATGRFAGQVAGWYPIVIEYTNDTTTAALQVNYSRSDIPGTWVNLAAITDSGTYSTPTASRVRCSPLGIYQGNPRLDSHYNLLTDVAKTFGLQFTCDPQSLESGQFPGTLTPLVRLGRDTEYMLDSIEGTGISTSLDSEDTVDTLLLDGKTTGADDSGSTTIEAIAFGEADAHMFVSSDQDSLGDISIPSLLSQRANTDVALRLSPWEQTGVTPKGQSQILDSFPLSAALARFDWKPGDGVRLQLPELGVVDQTPRQILGVSWPFSPNGISRPDVSFRQRPRSLKDMLRQQFRAAALDRRNNQGTRVTFQGSVGSSAALPAGPDGYSRVVMPTPFSALIKLELVVMYKSAANSALVEVNGSTSALAITGMGTYDITSLALPQTNGPGGAINFARLLGNPTLDDYEIALRITYAI